MTVTTYIYMHNSHKRNIFFSVRSDIALFRRCKLTNLSLGTQFTFPVIIHTQTHMQTLHALSLIPYYKLRRYISTIALHAPCTTDYLVSSDDSDLAKHWRESQITLSANDKYSDNAYNIIIALFFVIS